jgi:hypothetical protein
MLKTAFYSCDSHWNKKKEKEREDTTVWVWRWMRWMILWRWWNFDEWDSWTEVANGWARFVLLCEILRPPDGPHNRRATGKKTKPMTIFSVFFFYFFFYFFFILSHRHHSLFLFFSGFLSFSISLSLDHSSSACPRSVALSDCTCGLSYAFWIHSRCCPFISVVQYVSSVVASMYYFIHNQTWWQGSTKSDSLTEHIKRYSVSVQD